MRISAESPSSTVPPAPRCRVYRDGQVSETALEFVPDGQPLPTRGPISVSFQRFLAEKDALISRGEFGVRLDTSQSPDLLAPHIADLTLIDLHIPYFKDGRAFSWARILRSRLHYRGEIRLSGHFLLDQIAFFLRVGVNSFTIPGNWPAADVQKAAALISEVYQPSVDQRPTIADLRRRALLRAAAE